MGTIILVRHGQTDWNRIERFRGRYDVPLNEHGLNQGGAVADRIVSRCKPKRVLTSSLIRAKKTAEIIAKKTGIAVSIHQGLIDIDYGKWQGLTPEEVKARWPDESRLWYEHPEKVCIPGGETLKEVQVRAMKAMEEICRPCISEAIVMVSHTVVIRLILLGIMSAPLDRFWYLRQEPCAINLLEFKGDEFTIASMNDTCHLNKLGEL